jgi:hypothetical protein
LFKKIAALVIILILTLVLLSQSTWALSIDGESSTVNGLAAWTSSQWTQTTQEHFEAGVLNNIETSSSPGDAKIPMTVTSFSPSADIGDWTNGDNSYSSDDQYATFIPTAGLTKSPTANTGASWTGPANAYASDTSYATITSGAPSGSNVWGNYGFNLTGNTITQVRVRYDAFSVGSAITFQAAGANAAATSGNITPALPAAWAANDIWICLINSLDNVNSTMPAGWTAIDTGTNNGAALRTTVYWRRAVTGDTAPLITHTGGGYITASIVGYRGCIATGSPFDVNQPVNVKGTTSTVNDFGAGMTTNSNNDMIVLLSGASGQATSATYTGTPTPTERVDLPNTAGYGKLIIADFTLATAGATGARTSTLTVSRLNNGYQLSLKRDMPQIRVDVSWDGGTTWSAKQATTLTQTKTTYWYDVTSATGWDATKLNNANFKVRVDGLTVGFAAVVSLDWLPVEVTYYLVDAPITTWSHTFSNYGMNLTNALISTVEIGYEAFAVSAEELQVEVTWNNGMSWSARQTSPALGNTDPDSVTWFDFTTATGWTPDNLSNSKFKVRVWYVDNGNTEQLSLDYLPVRITYRISTGTIASPVFDTTYAGARWDALFWNETLLANTGITFEVRVSDTEFAMTDISPLWTSIGGNSPVLSGLPAGRYKQWRATLNTGTVENTPVLSEVRVYYYGN